MNDAPCCMPETHIKILVSRHNELLQYEKELNALHNGGVDNWEWYEEALVDAGLIIDPFKEAT